MSIKNLLQNAEVKVENKENIYDAKFIKFVNIKTRDYKQYKIETVKDYIKAYNRLKYYIKSNPEKNNKIENWKLEIMLYKK